jgi:hypothetical protein
MVLPVLRKKRRGPGLSQFMLGILVGFLLTVFTVIKIRSDAIKGVKLAPPPDLPARPQEIPKSNEVLKSLPAKQEPMEPNKVAQQPPPIEEVISPLESIKDPDKPGKLVIYSGPLYVTDDADPDLTELYISNFEWYLDHGIDCEDHDTVIVVGRPVVGKYKDRVAEIADKCKKETNHRVKMVTRHTECFHMGSLSLVLHGGFVNFDHYDFFFFITSALSGPAHKRPRGPDKPWTEMFTTRMTGPIRIVGLSHVCEGEDTHVQESAFCLDKTGFEILRHSEIVLDCEQALRDNADLSPQQIKKWQKSVEEKSRLFPINMSRTILNQADYAFTTLLRQPVKPIDKVNRMTCDAPDMWTVSKLKETFRGNIPSWMDVIWFKTTRYLPKEISKLIGFKGNNSWKWE